MQTGRTERQPRAGGGQGRLFASALAGAGLSRNKSGRIANASKQRVTLDAGKCPSPQRCVQAKEDFLQFCLGDAGPETFIESILPESPDTAVDKHVDETVVVHEDEEKKETVIDVSSHQVVEEAGKSIAVPDSIADFLGDITGHLHESCSGSAVLEISSDQAESQAVTAEALEPACFCMTMGGDSDSDVDNEREEEEDSGDELDLDDMYNFDPAKVAAAVERGAGFQQVRDTIEEELASALETRMTTVADPVLEIPEEFEADRPCITQDVTSLMTPPCSPKGQQITSEGPCIQESKPDSSAEVPQVLEDEISAQAMSTTTLTLQPGPMGITWNLTDGCIAEVDDGGSAHKAGIQAGWKFEKIEGEAFSYALLQVKQKGPEAFNVTFSTLEQTSCKIAACRSRRSSIERRTIKVAMEEAKSRREQDAKDSDAVAVVEKDPDHARRLRRTSLSKTVEVLDCIVGADAALDPEKADQANMIQEAMLAARQRHRASIAQAVEKLAAGTTEARPIVSQDTSLKDHQEPVSARIQQAISLAYQRHREHAWAGHDLAAYGPWQSTSCQDTYAQQNWNSDASYFQQGQGSWEETANAGCSVVDPSSSASHPYGCGTNAINAMWQENSGWQCESYNGGSYCQPWNNASWNQTGVDAWRLGSA